MLPTQNVIEPPDYYKAFNKTNKIDKFYINDDREIIKSTYDTKSVIGTIDFYRTKDITVNFVNLNYNDGFSVSINKDSELLEIYFKLDGFSFYKGDQNISEISSGCYSFFYFPELRGELLFKPHNCIQRAVGIGLTVSFLKRLFRDDLSVLSDFGKNIIKRKASFYANNRPISLQMRLLLEDVMDNSYTGILKENYIKSKVTELLILIVKQNRDMISESYSALFSKRDIEKIHYAREIVSKNLADPLSIKDLAREAGINEFKLKKGFKEVFGTTIFKYLLEYRMELSKRMLLSDDDIISEVAAKVGYKNSSHFAAAFKAYCGLTPSDFRQSKLSLTINR